MCLTEIHIKKPLIFVLLLVYILIVCTCSTIFFCEAALLVFRAFCVGHAISAAAPGSTMSSCPLSYIYLYIPVQMLRLLSNSVLRACSKAVGLCHIWIFVQREPAPEFIAIRRFQMLFVSFQTDVNYSFSQLFLTSTSSGLLTSAHVAVLTCRDSWTRRCDKHQCFHSPSWS